MLYKENYRNKFSVTKLNSPAMVNSLNAEDVEGNDLYLNYMSLEYERDEYKWNLIKQHEEGSILDYNNIQAHISNKIRGEFDEDLLERQQTGIYSYKPMFVSYLNELKSRVLRTAQHSLSSDETIYDLGPFDGNEQLQRIMDNFGSENITFENWSNMAQRKLSAYTTLYTLVHPPRTLNKQGTKILPPYVEVIDPTEILIYEKDKYAVRARQVSRNSPTVGNKPHTYCLYTVYYPFAERNYIIAQNDEGINYVKSFEPYPYIKPDQFYFKSAFEAQPKIKENMEIEDRLLFKNENDQPTLPIFRTDLDINVDYMYSLAAKNSYMTQEMSEIQFMLRNLSDVIWTFGDSKAIGSKDKTYDLVRNAYYDKQSVIPENTLEFKAPSPENVTTKERIFNEQEKDMRNYFFLTADDAAKEKTATEIKYDNEKTYAYVSVALDALGDLQTTALRYVYRMFNREDTAGMNKIKIRYNLKIKTDTNNEKDDDNKELRTEQTEANVDRTEAESEMG